MKLAFLGLFGAAVSQTDCHDVYDHCPSMKRFCGNPAFPGTDNYCPKTCELCHESRTGFALQPAVSVPGTAKPAITAKQIGK